MRNLFKIFLLTGLIFSLSFAGIRMGQQAPDFELPDIFTGKTYTMKDFKGKIVLLNLWASWCTGCKAEMPEFYKLQKEYKGKDFIIVAVSVDNNKDKAVEFLKHVEEKTGIKTPFVVLYDKNKKLARIYRPRGMPSSYLIDKDGKLIKIFIGSFTEENINYLKNEINKALGE